MMKNLFLSLFLSLIDHHHGRAAAPVLKHFLGFGPTAAYAANDDNQGPISLHFGIS